MDLPAPPWTQRRLPSAKDEPSTHLDNQDAESTMASKGAAHSEVLSSRASSSAGSTVTAESEPLTPTIWGDAHSPRENVLDGDDELSDDGSCSSGSESGHNRIGVSSTEALQGITVDLKTNMKVDKYDYRKSKDGKTGNALRPHNEIMTIMPSPIPGRAGTVSIPYPPYVGKKRKEEPGTEEQPTSGLYFKIGPKVHEYNCVRNSWLRSGFVRTTSWSKCAGYWGRHCSANAFRNLNRWQKVNHFPGSWSIGRKDRLGRIMGRMRRMHGSDFNIHAETMVMPMDRRKLSHLLSSEPKGLWIIKPASSSCGRGIRVVSSNTCNPKKLRKGTIVQRYLSRPYLIDGRKFDMRIYIIVTCYDPLRAYICEEGLVRFATGKYSRSLSSLKNRFVHLTNYSVNKNSESFVKPKSNAAGDGVEQSQAASKWTLTHLLSYFRENGIDDTKVLDDIKDCCVKTLISAEPHIASLVHQLNLSRTNCFEVFGFDIFLDHKLKPWLIEVNVSPSLSSSSPLDKRIKNKLLCDTFHIIGFKPYNHREEDRLQERGNMERLHHGSSHKSRPSTGSRRNSREFVSRNVLQLSPGKLSNLSDKDMEVLYEMEEEYARRGDFTRIYPTADPDLNAYYSQFFECARYNNTLVNLWIRARGVDSLTRKGVAGEKATQKAVTSKTTKTSRSQSRLYNTHKRTSLVERQSLSRARREVEARARIAGFEMMKKELQIEQEQRDKVWDREWDRAHGHSVSSDDAYSQESNDGRVYNEEETNATLVSPRIESFGVMSKSGHISRLQQRKLETQKDSDDPKIEDDPGSVSVADHLTPRAKMAQAILESARSDFAAIQDAMRAVGGARVHKADSQKASTIRLRSEGNRSVGKHRQSKGSTSQQSIQTDVWRVGHHDQRLTKTTNNHSSMGNGSAERENHRPTTFIAIAPGRDAVLAYQERQYNRLMKKSQGRSRNNYVGRRAVPTRPPSNRQRGVEELAANAQLSGKTIELQRYAHKAPSSNNLHAAWVRGRQPRYS